MLRLLDICFLGNPRSFGLERVAILVTSQGFWLFVFAAPLHIIREKKYKTMKGAQVEFLRQYAVGKNSKEWPQPEWRYIVKGGKTASREKER